MNDDITQHLNIAIRALKQVAPKTGDPEVYDMISMLFEYRNQYIEDNGQFGKGGGELNKINSAY